MSTEPINECQVYRPTIWDRLGFGYSHAPLIDDEAHPDLPPGAFICETFAKLDWVDRLRCLVSGKLHIQTRSKTNVQIDRAITTSNIRVLSPTFQFEKHRRSSNPA
jgi:hypothetical protein